MKYRCEATVGREGCESGKWGTLRQALGDMQMIEDSARLMKEGDAELDKSRQMLKEYGGTMEPLRRKSETWSAKVVDEKHKVYTSKSWTVRVIV